MLYLTQLTGLVLITLSNGGDCPLKIQPVKLAVEFGASASANCFTTTTHHGMGWKASQGPVDMEEDVQSLTWRVDRLTHWDIKPLCYMNIKEQCSRNLPVIVYKGPDRVSISTVDHTGPMTEGGQYELLCDVQNVAPVRLLTVNWYKGRDLVKRENFSEETSFPDSKTATLQISPSKDDDGVQYRCEAELELGPEAPQSPPKVTSDPLDITVHHGPEIEPGKASEVVKEGEAVSLSCTAEGNPEPEVTWSFQSQTKATGRRQTTLTISKATHADDGVYTCTATNELGSDTKTVSVRVKGGFLLEIQPVKLVVEFGATASANCFTNTTHNGMGWEASQGPVDIVENVQSLTWRVDSLTHWDIRPICFINMEDQCVMELPVIVYKRPDRVSISTMDHTGPMTEGRQYELLCDVENVAPVRLLTVNWYKGHDLVKRESFSDETKFPANRIVTLQISPNKADNGVQYRCEAELKLGEEEPQPPPKVTSGPLDITVHYGPEIEPGKASDVVKEGEAVSLSCTAEGNPEPEVTWSFQSQTKATGRRQTTLTISKATHADDGVYTCTATNELGSDTRTVSVRVKAQFSQCSDLVLEPPELVVRYGDPVSVSCRSLSEYTDLGWIVSLGSVSSLDNQTVIWKTNNLTNWEMQPVCYKILNGVQCRKTLPLTVYKLPDEVSFRIVNYIGQMIEGRKYELQCDVYNFAPVNVLAAFWYKGEELLKNRGFAELSTKTPSNKTVSHKITAGRDEGEAQYWCEAKLKLGPAGPQPSPIIKSNLLKVAVHYGPEIEPGNSSHVMQKGEAVSLSCTAEGNPEPEVTWSFQSKTKATGRRQTTLTISEATFADDGVYTCTAINDLGNDTRTVRVEVQGDCPIKIQPVKLVVEFGASASANCSTSITHHGMGWEASQGPVDMDEDVQLITWRVDRLTHWDIKPLCYMNIKEQCSRNLPAIVYKRPDRVSISTVDHTGPMTEGRQYELLCDVQNVAPVRLLTVNWYKGRHLMKRENFSDETSFPDNITATLQISPSEDDDGVQYRCEAELNLGPEGPQSPPTVTSDPLDITVHHDCPIKIQPVKLVVEFGASASANCSTSITHHGMGWEASQGPVDMDEDVQLITWRVDRLTHWDIKPLCYMNIKEQCSRNLPVIVYKIPDRVSISTVDHTGPMTEGRQYELLCDVQNVAPVRLLTVNWYKGRHLMKRENFSDETSFPDNITATLQISPSEDDDGVQYRCEAELNLGPEGPQSPPTVTSDPLDITVHRD